MNGVYHYGAKKPFSISRQIPFFGEIEDNSVTSINLPAVMANQREESFEERQENLKEYREDDKDLYSDLCSDQLIGRHATISV